MYWCASWHFLKKGPQMILMHRLNWDTLCVFYPTSFSQHTRTLIGCLEPTNKHKQVKPNQHKNKTTPLLHFRMMMKIFPKTAASLYCLALSTILRSEEWKEYEFQAHPGTEISWWPVSWVTLQGSALYRSSFIKGCIVLGLWDKYKRQIHLPVTGSLYFAYLYSHTD